MFLCFCCSTKPDIWIWSVGLFLCSQTVFGSGTSSVHIKSLVCHARFQIHSMQLLHPLSVYIRIYIHIYMHSNLAIQNLETKILSFKLGKVFFKLSNIEKLTTDDDLLMTHTDDGLLTTHLLWHCPADHHLHVLLVSQRKQSDQVLVKCQNAVVIQI